MSNFAGSNRFLWNKALSLQKSRLDRKEKILSYGDLALLTKLWRQSDEYGFLENSHSQIQQQTLKDLDKAICDGLKKTKGMPKFKKKGRNDSFRYPQGFQLNKNSIFLPKIGWMKFHKSREIVGKAKNITVSRKGKSWYVSIQTEIEIQTPKHQSQSVIGADLGVTRFLTLSDGTYYEPLNAFRKQEQKLRREQRKLSRKIKFSKNWHMQKHKVTKQHIKITNSREDYLHKLTSRLSKNHAVIVLEDLRIKNMSKSAKGTLENPGRNVKAKSGLNKSILDQSWHKFRTMLEYKMRDTGGQVIYINPRNTSCTCPECKHASKANRRSQSEFECEQCHHSGNADEIAARNILAVGHTVLACGDISLKIG